MVSCIWIFLFRRRHSLFCFYLQVILVFNVLWEHGEWELHVLVSVEGCIEFEGFGKVVGVVFMDVFDSKVSTTRENAMGRVICLHKPGVWATSKYP